VELPDRRPSARAQRARADTGKEESGHAGPKGKGSIRPSLGHRARLEAIAGAQGLQVTIVSIKDFDLTAQFTLGSKT
jgi:hypothetical protein